MSLTNSVETLQSVTTEGATEPCEYYGEIAEDTKETTTTEENENENENKDDDFEPDEKLLVPDGNNEDEEDGGECVYYDNQI